MPPSAAPEWLRTGWIFEISATSAPASYASMAARIPAQPAPTTSTSCLASTADDAIGRPQAAASRQRARGDDPLACVRGELLEVLAEHPRELRRRAVVLPRIAPRRARVEEPRHDTGHRNGNLEAEHVVRPVLHAVEIAGQRRGQQRTRLDDRHPLTLAERSASPAGVDQPDRRAVTIEFL